MTSTSFVFLGQNLHLHPCKAIFWEEKSALLIADLHLGKAEHFRKEGIPVPRNAGDVNWDKLINLLLEFQPKRVLLLGDLFHSTYNSKWEEWIDFMQQFEEVQFELILGNHDILSAKNYEKSGMIIHETLAESPFYLTHEPEDEIPVNLYNLCGHIHPCVYLSGSGKQRMRLPCFYFGERQGILPAFGDFTGMYGISAKRGDQVFVIAEDSVLEV